MAQKAHVGHREGARYLCSHGALGGAFGPKSGVGLATSKHWEAPVARGAAGGSIKEGGPDGATEVHRRTQPAVDGVEVAPDG